MVKSALDYIDGKERRKYAEKHGISSLINYYHGLPWNDKESERVYKICNEKGITWEKHYNISLKKMLF